MNSLKIIEVKGEIGKVKLVSVLHSSSCHKLIWAMEVEFHAFTLALDKGRLSTSHPCCFMPGETAHCIH
jgi:hypothetical protein